MIEHIAAIEKMPQKTGRYRVHAAIPQADGVLSMLEEIRKQKTLRSHASLSPVPRPPQRASATEGYVANTFAKVEGRGGTFSPSSCVNNTQRMKQVELWGRKMVLPFPCDVPTPRIPFAPLPWGWSQGTGTQSEYLCVDADMIF